MGDEDPAKQAKEEQNIEMWKVKKLVKSLEAARGCAQPCSLRAQPCSWGCSSPPPATARPRLLLSCLPPRAWPVRGSNGTSMISLILPPKSQISMAAKMLADEYGTASNIKSRVNRLSVLSAITSTQQRLKLFTKV